MSGAPEKGGAADAQLDELVRLAYYRNILEESGYADKVRALGIEGAKQALTEGSCIDVRLIIDLDDLSRPVLRGTGGFLEPPLLRRPSPKDVPGLQGAAQSMLVDHLGKAWNIVVSIGFTGDFGDQTVTPRQLAGSGYFQGTLVNVHGMVREVGKPVDRPTDKAGLKGGNVVVQKVTLEDLPNSRPPKTVDCLLERDLVGKVQPGDRVALAGVFDRFGVSTSGGQSTANTLAVLVNNVSSLPEPPKLTAAKPGRAFAASAQPEKKARMA